LIVPVAFAFQIFSPKFASVTAVLLVPTFSTSVIVEAFGTLATVHSKWAQGEPATRTLLPAARLVGNNPVAAGTEVRLVTDEPVGRGFPRRSSPRPPLVVTLAVVGTTRLCCGQVVMLQFVNGGAGNVPDGNATVPVVVRGSVTLCIALMQVWPLSAVRQKSTTSPPLSFPLPMKFTRRSVSE
jgi:hypothetical protein